MSSNTLQGWDYESVSLKLCITCTRGVLPVQPTATPAVDHTRLMSIVLDWSDSEDELFKGVGPDVFVFV